eukprot:m.246074 g.246074  ORF g.246074 m.246074 type:complete len:56 (+) comp40257_c0_seq9:451-618(+)
MCTQENTCNGVNFCQILDININDDFVCLFVCLYVFTHVVFHFHSFHSAFLLLVLF